MTSMQALIYIVIVVLVIVLILIAAVKPHRPTLSIFELNRRKDEGNKSAAEELKRLDALEYVWPIKRAMEAVIIVCLTALLMFVWPLFGVVPAFVVALVYRRVAMIEVVRVGAQRIFDELDGRIVGFIGRHQSVVTFFGRNDLFGTKSSVGSREELENLIKESSSILSGDEKKLLLNSLHFPERKVEEIMTPRGVIEMIDQREMLGPIVLDQLHKTGHSRFPVIAENIDHIVGVLHIRELLSLQQKSSQDVKAAMEKKVYYINQSQTLQRALAAFLSTRHHLFIVVNEYRETAGILTLEDCIEALLGRKIVDEFDTHEDLRIVAARNAKQNNNPPQATNV